MKNARLRLGLPVLILIALLVLFARSWSLQAHEDRLMRITVARVLHESGASTQLDQVLAIRDFVRKHVTFRGAVRARTSPLRDTASRVLSTGKGYCGEDTRLFVCLAWAAGIPAQRVNLYGSQPHVVAEVGLADRRATLVDCQNPPTVTHLEPLDEIIAERRYGYTDYSTIHFSRFGLTSSLRRLHFHLGRHSKWLESPHEIMMSVYGTAALGWACVILIWLAPTRRWSIRRVIPLRTPATRPSGD